MAAQQSLPYVDPRAERGPLYRLLVRFISTGFMTWLSRTRLWGAAHLEDRSAGERLHGRSSAEQDCSSRLRCSKLRGARTGRLRTNAVIYFHDGERVTIIASQAGLPRTRPWHTTTLARTGMSRSPAARSVRSSSRTRRASTALGACRPRPARIRPLPRHGRPRRPDHPDPPARPCTRRHRAEPARSPTAKDAGVKAYFVRRAPRTQAGLLRSRLSRSSRPSRAESGG